MEVKSEPPLAGKGGRESSTGGGEVVQAKSGEEAGSAESDKYALPLEPGKLAVQAYCVAVAGVRKGALLVLQLGVQVGARLGMAMDEVLQQ